MQAQCKLTASSVLCWYAGSLGISALPEDSAILKDLNKLSLRVLYGRTAEPGCGRMKLLPVGDDLKIWHNNKVSGWTLNTSGSKI